MATMSNQNQESRTKVQKGEYNLPVIIEAGCDLKNIYRLKILTTKRAKDELHALFTKNLIVFWVQGQFLLLQF